MLAVPSAMPTAPTIGMVERTRVRVLRRCSAEMVDFTDRTAVLFAMTSTVPRGRRTRMGLCLVRAIEVVTVLGMFGTYAAAAVTGGVVGEFGLTAG